MSVSTPAQTSKETPALFTPDFWRLSIASLCFFISYHLLTATFTTYAELGGIKGWFLGVMVGGFTVASLLLRPFSGRWSDRYGERRLMLIGATLFTLGAFCYGPAFGKPMALLAIQLFRGIGLALFYTSSSSMITRIVPAARRTEGISHYGNAIKVAMAVSPPLGLWLISTPLVSGDGFSWVFGIAAATTVAAWLLIYPLPVKPRAVKAVGKPGKLIQRKALYPGLVMTSSTLAFGALIPFIPQLARESHLGSLAQAFYTLYAVALIFSRGATGTLADKHGRLLVVVPGMVGVTASLALLGLFHNPWAFTLGALLYGVSAGSVQPSLIAMTTGESWGQRTGGGHGDIHRPQ